MTTSHVPSSSTVYTPDALASAMVRALGDKPSSVWLDPCVGDGAFVAGISGLGIPSQHILAFDLNPESAVRDALAQTHRDVDFIAWASSQQQPACDRLIMNPPYVALSKLQGAPRSAALSLSGPNGERIPLKANYWCAFVLAAMHVLRPDGCMAAVLPAAWDYARYARSIRETLVEGFGEVTIIRSTSPLFPGVLEGAVVVIAKKRLHPSRTVRRIETPDAAGMIQILDDLSKGRTPPSVKTIFPIKSKRQQETRLGDLLDIRIGGVTGDAHYFLMTEDQRRAFGLPRAALRPVLTRCRHLRRAIFTQQEWQDLLEAGERVWLFSPAGSALEHDAVRRYLEEGKERKKCHTDRYKIKAREPWYQTPVPTRIDGFLSGMSKRLPFLVLREIPRLSATNTLYVARFKRPADLQKRLAVGIALLSSQVRKDLAVRARVYADGLLKFEPAELGNVRIPLPEEHRSDARQVFETATELLLSGRETEAQDLADTWIEEGVTTQLLARPHLDPTRRQA